MAISEGDRHDAYLRRVQPPVLDADDVVAALRRRAMFVAGVTLACAAASLLYILLATPRYVASGRIDFGPQVAADAASRVQAITSQQIFNKVIAREKLDGDPLFGARLSGILPALLVRVGLVPAADPHVLALRQLERAVSVTPEPNSSTVNVTAVTPDRDMSARVANAVMDSYIENVSRPQNKTAPDVSAPADALRKSLQGRLRDAEERYRIYRQDKGITGDSDPWMLEKQVNELSAQIAAAETRVSSLRSTLSQLQRASNDRNVDAVPAALRSRTLDALRNRYATARRIEADLSETLGPRHPDLKFAGQQLAEARQLLDQAIGDIAQSTAGELGRARSELTRLRTRLDAVKKDLTASSGVTSRLRELEHNVETSRADYQAFLSKPQSLGEQQPSIDPFPRILSRATPQPERGGASPVRILLISSLLGFGLAVSLAWLLELARGQGAGSHFNR